MDSSDGPASTPTKDQDRPQRRGYGQLTLDVKAITDAWIGDLNYLGDPDIPLTPYRIAQLIEEQTDVPATPASIERILREWWIVGFADLTENPLAFANYTQEAVEVGLEELKSRYREEVKAARSEAKDSIDGRRLQAARQRTELYLRMAAENWDQHYEPQRRHDPGPEPTDDDVATIPALKLVHSQDDDELTVEEERQFLQVVTRSGTSLVGQPEPSDDELRAIDLEDSNVDPDYPFFKLTE